MLNHFPRLSHQQPLGATAHSASKLGGLPWGLPAAQWPICAECDCPMSLVAQLAPSLAVPRISPASSLFVFKCERDSVCDFWEPDSGANACLLLPHAQMTEGVTPMPAAVPDASGKPQPDWIKGQQAEPAPVLQELWVHGWQTEDDRVPAELEPQYYDARFYDLPNDLQTPHGFEGRQRTKAGGVPYWTGNGNGCLPDSADRMLLQINTFVYVGDGADTKASDASQGEFVDFANFCSDGIGFVMDRTPQAPTPDPYFMILR